MMKPKYAALMTPDTTGSITILAVQAMYAMTFVLAAWLKWMEGTPPWFLMQFHDTWLANLPGGLDGVYRVLASLETIAALGFSASLFSGEAFRTRRALLRLSLAYALFIFVVLAYGSRLTGKFDIAGWNFLYFIGTVIALRFEQRNAVEREATGPLSSPSSMLPRP